MNTKTKSEPRIWMHSINYSASSQGHKRNPSVGTIKCTLRSLPEYSNKKLNRMRISELRRAWRRLVWTPILESEAIDRISEKIREEEDARILAEFYKSPLGLPYIDSIPAREIETMIESNSLADIRETDDAEFLTYIQEAIESLEKGNT